MKWILSITMLMVALGGAAEVVDRVAAIVNGRAILVSQVDESARFAALVEGRKPSNIADRDRAAALVRLIDQELIRQRIDSAGVLTATDQEIAVKAAEVRKQIAANLDDAGWQARLAEYGLDDTDFSAQLRGGLDELRFVEVRFRPSAHITAPEIEAYYRDQYVPKMRSAGAKEKPLTDVRSQIEEILVQQQVDSLLSTWLQNLRSEGDVHVLVNFGIAEPKPAGTSGSSSQSH